MITEKQIEMPFGREASLSSLERILDTTKEAVSKYKKVYLSSFVLKEAETEDSEKYKIIANIILTRHEPNPKFMKDVLLAREIKCILNVPFTIPEDEFEIKVYYDARVQVQHFHLYDDLMEKLNKEGYKLNGEGWFQVDRKILPDRVKCYSIKKK